MTYAENARQIGEHPFSPSLLTVGYALTATLLMIGLVLAGGSARRLGGGDKALAILRGRTVLARVLEALEPQCETILLNANGDASRFTAYGKVVIPDDLPDRPGPLAGLLAGLDYVASHHVETGFLLSVPADAPFLPHDLVARLEDKRVADRAAVVCARSGDNVHATIALWSVALRKDLRRALVEEGLRKVSAFAARHPMATVAWPTHPIDPFLNVNTPEDLAGAERIAGGV